MSASLLIDTLEALNINGHRPVEVQWGGTVDGHYVVNWKHYEEMARNFNSALVSPRLVVVGSDWWLERIGDDWVYKRQPKAHSHAPHLERL